MERQPVTIPIIDVRVKNVLNEIEKRKKRGSVRSLGFAIATILANLHDNNLVDEMLVFKPIENENEEKEV